MYKTILYVDPCLDFYIILIYYNLTLSNDQSVCLIESLVNCVWNSSIWPTEIGERIVIAQTAKGNVHLKLIQLFINE